MSLIQEDVIEIQVVIQCMELFNGTSIRKVNEDIVYTKIWDRNEDKTLKDIENDNIVTTKSNDSVGIFNVQLDFTSNPLPLACPTAEVENNIKIEFVGKKMVASTLGSLQVGSNLFSGEVEYTPNNLNENDYAWFFNSEFINEFNVEFRNYDGTISFTADILKDNNKLTLTTLTGNLPEVDTTYENITMIIPSISLDKDKKGAFEIKTSYGMKLFGLDGKEII